MKKEKNFLEFKNENGSITLFVLIAMLFFLIVALGIYFGSQNKLQSQISEIDEIKKNYEISDDDLDTMYSDIIKVPELWRRTTTDDPEWYSYIDANAENEETAVATVNAPKLTGGMEPIKYVGPEADTQTGSKWANAITSDGSMFVWIPRYAYKITSGYHQSGTDTTGGTIEIKFLKGTTNEFLDGSGEAETDPSKITYKDDGTGNQVQNEWLVHPAFTSVPENGGWDTELEGIWVGKFETTGEYTDGDASKVTVKPGEQSLANMTINEQYKAGKSATFGEANSELIGSHMAKNSEWGAIVYLTQSKYGINGQEVQRNTNNVGQTGGSNDPKTIYTTNKKQSTTYNSYGIYDMVGGSNENIASYVNYTYVNNNHLANNGGTAQGDLYGANETEQKTSTKYKTVYAASGTSQSSSYNLAAEKKGDGVYETSNSYSSSTGAWFGDSFTFPYINLPFFRRSGHYGENNVGIFSSTTHNGIAIGTSSFRLIIII